MSVRVTEGDLIELARRWDLLLITDGHARDVVPQARFLLGLRHQGWWQLLDRPAVLGWLTRLQQQGPPPDRPAGAGRWPTTAEIADAINASGELPTG